MNGLMVERAYPWFPDGEYEKKYVRDNQGTIWLLVHDEGMVTTADYSGTIYSAGTHWLKINHGPLEEV